MVVIKRLKNESDDSAAVIGTFVDDWSWLDSGYIFAKQFFFTKLNFYNTKLLRDYNESNRLLLDKSIIFGLEDK